ncbi:ComF family protein [Streptomyces capparidis]
MREWLGNLADLVLPTDCAGCGRSRGGLCDRCRDLVRGPGGRRVRPVPAPPGLPPVYAATGYGGAVRAVLLAHKERGALPLARPLGEALARAVRAAPVPRDADVLLLPVPSARGAVAARGQDPTRRIALAAAGALRRDGLPARVARGLRQRRPVADQSRLDPGERLANVAGALHVPDGARARLRGAPVVLVDDLLTTGATLAEATRAARAAGARVAAAAVVAAPPGAMWG